MTDAYDDDNLREFFSGYIEHHKLDYLKETFIGENIVKGSTTIEDVEKILSNPQNQRLSLKFYNMKRAIEKLFPTIIRTEIDITRFTPKFIMDIHKIIGEGVIDDAGQYRKKFCKPSKVDWVYLYPDLIEKSLEGLCCNVRNAMETEEDILTKIKITSSFVTNFLHIHPFSNGNGRTARLLASWLLSTISIVPIPFYSSSAASKDDFLNCVIEAQQFSDFIPKDLSLYILEAVQHCNRITVFCLDL
ncbi:hypothetical protein HK103_003183 [Boothiomyces macroporosus]|uniref:Fido domain-containing protein n=1 Tax=Boothiomyces macroporosus TaxID=261099 RepID=A0AAD5Y047_9FUNG|nr:hypothetical protein HK103_003183 [Boothiomyces macroporosus]